MQEFNPQEETKKIVEFIKNYYKENNLGGAVLGVSGGKDSAVVAGLLVKGLGKENVIGVTLPCYSNEEDKIDAKIVSDYFGFNLINFDITNIFDTFKNQVKTLGDFSDEELKNSDINIKPRLRMSTLYYLSALYSAINNKTYLVAGTSNKCELFVGYFTKGGDNIHDISLIADFTVDEVIKIGEYMNVPKQVLYKKPNDGISNKTDEEELGVTYKEITKYMNNDKLDEETENKIRELHNNSKHKFNIPTYKKGY